MKNLLCFAVLCLCTCSLTAQIHYVTPAGAGTMDGTSWTNASSDLQAMIDASANGEQVWVASGTYLPTVRRDANDPRSASFVMKEGVEIYGGLTVGATNLSNRDFTANGSVLSGDIDGMPGDNSGNSYHVIFNDFENQPPLTSAAVLNGFTVSGGNANGGGFKGQGGGMWNSYSSPKVTNCSFSGNRAEFGGGMFNIVSTSELDNCRFFNNHAGDNGGGMVNSNSNLELDNCSFSGNHTDRDGGGMYNLFSNPRLINCSFLGNQTDHDGGGMYNNESEPRLINCSFSGNLANTGGGMYNFSFSSPELTNCLIYNNQEGNSTSIPEASVANFDNSNPTYSYSLIQNITDGTGNNLDGSLDPLFVDPPNPAAAPTTAGDLRLQVCSPAINAGLNSENNTAEDLAGNPRIYASGIIDLGAFEYQDENVITTAATPGAAVTWTGTSGTNWQNGCNWEDRGIPGVSNAVIVPNGTPNAPELQPNTTYAAQDLTLHPGVQLTLPAGSTFDIGGTLLLDGATLTNEGTLDPGATTLQNGGKLTNRGRVE